MDEYSALLKEYYRLEAQILQDASARLAGGKDAQETRHAVEGLLGELRRWILEAIQGRQARISDLETSLRMTRESLRSAQDRMEGMERENAEAARVLLKMRIQAERGESASEPAEDLRRRLEEQETLLKRREAETLSLANRLQKAQGELEGLLKRLSTQESARASDSGGSAGRREEALLLERRAAQAEDRVRRLEEQLKAMEQRLREADAAREEFHRRLREESAQAKELSDAREESARAREESQRLERRAAESAARAERLEAEKRAMEQSLREAEAARGELERILQAQQAQSEVRTSEESKRLAEEIRRLERRLAGSEERAQRLEAEKRALEEGLAESAAARAGLENRLREQQARSKELSSASEESARAREENRRLERRLAEAEGQAGRLLAEKRVWEERLRQAEAARRELDDRLEELEAARVERDAQLEPLREELRVARAQEKALRRRIEALEAEKALAQQAGAGRPEGVIERLRARLAELEAREKERGPEQEELRKKLREAEEFTAGFMQRIEALEAERAKLLAAQAAVQAAKPPTALQAAVWAAEKAELQERLIVMEADLSNLRRAYENSERDWIETTTRQDMARMQEISILKTELEKLRKP